MSQTNRRELWKSSGFLFAGPQFSTASPYVPGAYVSVTGIKLRSWEIMRTRRRSRPRHRNKRCARLQAIVALDVTVPRVSIHNAVKVDLA